MAINLLIRNIKREDMPHNALYQLRGVPATRFRISLAQSLTESDRKTKYRLHAAGFADQAGGLLPTYREIDSVHCSHDAVRSRKPRSSGKRFSVKS